MKIKLKDFVSKNLPSLKKGIIKIIKKIYLLNSRIDELQYRKYTYYNPTNSGTNLYRQYSLDFTPIPRYIILNFLKKVIPKKDDLIIVPTIYLESIKSKFPNINSIYDTLHLPKKIDFNIYERLIWASDRVDKNAELAQLFYKSHKEILVVDNNGPARNFYHDETKENVLRNEFTTQNKEGIQKFSHGIASDAGYLLQCLDNVGNIKGDIIEIGCYEGSSACIIAQYMSKLNLKKNFVVFDYFDGFTYKEAIKSKDKQWAFTHQTDGLLKVQERITKRWNKNCGELKVYKRNIIDKDSLDDLESICFANIDVDLYEAVKCALFRVDKKLSKNGLILVEDAGHTPNLLGAKVALEEFIEEVGNNKYLQFQLDSGQYLLIKLEK